MKKIALVIAGMTMASMFSVALIAFGSERNVAAKESTTAIRSASRKVDLNSASIRELKQLPGMGPELAERVLQHRPYHKLDELISRKVLGRKEFARIKERIRVSSTQTRNSTP